MFKMLLLGPRLNKRNPEKTGGVIVLFEDLLNQFEKKNISFEVIDTNKENYSNKIIALISIYMQFLSKILKFTHISIHGTAKDYIFITPFIIFISKFFKKHISLRKFAGNFDDIYIKAPPLKKMIIEYVLKNSDANFFETKYLVKFFKKININTYWFPNVRNKSIFRTNKLFQKRFIFIGNITKEKGIDTILSLKKLVENDITINLYGNLKEYNAHDLRRPNIKFNGPLKSEEVLEKLSEYDVLILPSLREGYPGIIIEAFSVGLPIIATELEGIKEIVNKDCAFLIKKNNSDELFNAMNYFDLENYPIMRKSSLEQFKYFNSDSQTQLFLERITCK